MRSTAYPWPGNVRELENALERAEVLTGDSLEIPLSALPDRVREEPAGAHRERGGSRESPMEIIERAYIEWVLRAEGGNKSRAAEVLGIDPSTLYRKIARYGLTPDRGETMPADWPTNLRGRPSPPPGPPLPWDRVVLSVVIPTYNEVATARALLERVREVPLRLEVIVVDDGSSDGTRDLLEEPPRRGARRHPGLPREEPGEGAAVRTGFGPPRATWW
jgi:hypothetical protein